MQTVFSRFFIYAAKQIPVITLLCLMSFSSWAANDDAKQPIHIEADRMQYDNANKVSRFFGNVVASQGSLTIRAAQMDVRQVALGHQLGVAIGSAQHRAYFRQNRDNTNEYIEGEAIRLEYDSRTTTLKLVGDATIRRYRGTELWDQSSGGVITYNDTTSFFTVESGPNSSSASGRMTMVLTPEPND
jgi:lipopolysaccharide export system protein LptA